MQKKRPSPITVMIVDDHPLFRDGVFTTLNMEDDIEVIAQAEDGAEGLKLIRKRQPNIVLMDVNLPTMNGLQVIRNFKAQKIPTAAIIITAHHDEAQTVHAMRSGASAFCSKDILPDQLIQIIRDVADGQYIIDNKRLSKENVDRWIEENVQDLSGPYPVGEEEHYIPLSPREVEILQFVANGMSNKEIANRLNISQQTVKNHMTSILRKLNVDDRTQAAVTALRHGWVRIEN